MKNRTENAPGKTGVFDGHPLPPYDRLAEMAAATATEPPPNTPKPAQGPSVGLYAMVLLVAGPFALLGLLLGLCAQVLRLPSAVVYLVAYFAGWAAKAITLRIVGNPVPPPQ